MPSVSRGVIWTLYFIVFIDVFQICFVFPILPKIIEGFGKGATEIGLLGSIAAIAEAIAAPFLGGLSDKYGRRPVLVVAMVGSMTGSVALGLSQSYLMIVAARLVGGICGGTGGIVMAYLSEVTTEDERPGYITYFMASIFAGCSLGPAVAGFINAFAGWRVACFAAAAACAANLLFMLIFLPAAPGCGDAAASETSPAGPEACEESTPERSRLHGIREFFSLPRAAWLIGGAQFCASIGFTAFEAIAVLYIQDTFFSGFQHPEDPASLFYSNVISGVGVTGLVTNLFLYSRIEKMTGLKGSIVLGGLVKAIAVLGIALKIGGKWGFFSMVQALVLGDQMQCTSIQMMITIAVDPSAFGKANGMMSFFGNAARGIGPFSFGPIYERGGHAAPWFVNVFTALIAVFLCVLAPSKPVVAEDHPIDAGGDTTPQLIRQLSHQPTRAMLCGNFALVSSIGIKGNPLRRALTWHVRETSFESPPTTNMQRSHTTEA